VGETSLALVADSAGRVWLGYTDQVVMALGDSTRVYSDSDGLHVGLVTALHVTSRRLWIGGSNGLAVMKAVAFTRSRARRRFET